MTACFLVLHNVLSVTRSFLTSCYCSLPLPAAAPVFPAQKSSPQGCINSFTLFSSKGRWCIAAAILALAKKVLVNCRFEVKQVRLTIEWFPLFRMRELQKAQAQWAQLLLQDSLFSVAHRHTHRNQSMNTLFTLEYTQISCPSQKSDKLPFPFLKYRQRMSKPEEVKGGLERSPEHKKARESV